jgi:hypothetical protein
VKDLPYHARLVYNDINAGWVYLDTLLHVIFEIVTGFLSDNIYCLQLSDLELISL